MPPDSVEEAADDPKAGWKMLGEHRDDCHAENDRRGLTFVVVPPDVLDRAIEDAAQDLFEGRMGFRATGPEYDSFKGHGRTLDKCRGAARIAVLSAAPVIFEAGREHGRREQVEAVEDHHYERGIKAGRAAERARIKAGLLSGEALDVACRADYEQDAPPQRTWDRMPPSRKEFYKRGIGAALRAALLATIDQGEGETDAT